MSSPLCCCERDVMAQQDVIAVAARGFRPKAACHSHVALPIPAVPSPCFPTTTDRIDVAAAMTCGDKQSFDAIFLPGAIGA